MAKPLVVIFARDTKDTRAAAVRAALQERYGENGPRIEIIITKQDWFNIAGGARGVDRKGGIPKVVVAFNDFVEEKRLTDVFFGTGSPPVEGIPYISPAQKYAKTAIFSESLTGVESSNDSKRVRRFEMHGDRAPVPPDLLNGIDAVLKLSGKERAYRGHHRQDRPR